MHWPGFSVSVTVTAGELLQWFGCQMRSRNLLTDRVTEPFKERGLKP